MRLFLIFGFWLFSQNVSASFLRIISESNLFLFEKQGEIFLRGNFTLENQGDEAASDVFPEFTIDRWALALPKQALGQNQKFTWEVNERIPRSRLCLKVSKGCLLALPSQGDFRVRIDKNYRDQNGYPFSAPDILNLSFKKKPSLGQELEPFKLELQVIAKGDSEYRADYVIRNQLERPLKLALHYLVPKEVDLRTPDLPVEVSANGELRGSFVFKNKSGLTGSTYLSLLVAETVDHNERKFIWSPAQFKVQKFIDPPKKSQISFSKEKIFVFLWGFLSLLAFVWVYFYWQRRTH